MQDFKYVSTTIWIPLLNNGILFAFRRPLEKIILPCYTLEIKEYSWFSCYLKCCVQMNDRSWSLRSLCVPWKRCKTPEDKTVFFEITQRVTYQKKSHIRVNFLILGEEMFSKKCLKLMFSCSKENQLSL